MKRLAQLFLFLCLPFVLNAQKLRFEKYTLQDGLSIIGHDFKMYQDSLGFLWIPSFNGLNRFDGREFRVFKYKREKPFDLSGNDITDIVPGPNNELWIGVGGGGINIYHPESGLFEHLYHNPQDPESLCTNYVMHINKDGAGNMWIQGLHPINGRRRVTCACNVSDRKFKKYTGSLPRGILNQKDGSFLTAGPAGIFQYLPKKDSFTLLQAFPNDEHDNYHGVKEVFINGQHKILLMAPGKALKFYNLTTQTFENLPAEINFVPLSVNGIHKDKSNHIWIGDFQRVLEYNLHNGVVDEHRHVPEDPTSLIIGRVASIFQDRGGSMWFSSTFMGGLSVAHTVNNPFEVVQPKDFRDTILLRPPFALLNSLEGVTILDLSEKSILAEGLLIPKWAIFSSAVAISSKHELWWWDRERKKIFNYNLKTQQARPPLDYNKYFVLDSKGNLWLEKMLYYDTEKDTIIDYGNYLRTIYPSLQNVRLLARSFFVDKEDQLWQGTNFDGILRFDPATRQLQIFSYDPTNPNSPPSGKITRILPGENGWYYIDSSLGFSIYKPELDRFEHWDESDGFPGSGKTPPMVEDKNGHLWMGMLSGLIRLDPQPFTFQLFNEQDGLPSGTFNNWFTKGSQGQLLVRKGNDLIRFHPDSIKLHTHVESVVLTDFYLNLKKVEIGGEDSLLNKSIAYQKKVVLNHLQSDFGFRFVSPNFYKPKMTQYYYKLENYSEDWINNGNKLEVHFTNIPAGNYIFKVKAKSASGFWTEAPSAVQIKVLPPWWETSWAYFLYSIAALTAFYLVYRYQLRKQLAEAEAVRLKELNAVKTKLYTNITHEFRTPLTVIQGMADQIEKNPQEARKLIRRNSKNLLHLVTQLLDMSKLESRKMQINLIQGNIISYLQYLTQSFESYAQTKNIQLHFDSEEDEVMMDYDYEKIQHIVSNLLSNAIKFTHKGGAIKMEVSKISLPQFRNTTEVLRIKVRDNGMGIREEYLPHIFDRFYQADDSTVRRGEGSGIGLALAKELLELMNGSISVESELGQGTEFKVLLPVISSKALAGTDKPEETSVLSKQKIEPHPTSEVSSQAKPSNLAAADSPLLLLIEDNPDVRHYIKSCLEDQYQLHFASDGKEGIEKALDFIPDIIISDVMMPEKDGYEVTQTLKNNVCTSHIPIILLTAKADIDSKIEGLERGADAYLAKPFNKKELLVRLEKLIENRQKMQAHFAKLAPSKATADPSTQIEDFFLKKVREIIEAHISESQFNVNSLCREIGISQPQLYRKIKALTNKSIASFIRTVRLHKGRELLQTTEAIVSEVAYDVGFSDPSYFSKTFSQEFGYPPSDLISRE